MKLRTQPTCEAGRRDSRRGRAAFTFAEVLAALVFMAIVIPVAMQGLQVASRAGVVAERKAVAVQLADRLLNESVIMDNWRNTGQKGTVIQDGKEFSWRLFNEAWIQNTMRLLSVEVTYMVQGREYIVRVSTLVKATV
jgi:type II secretory pathway pseudopilin PulG